MSLSEEELRRFLEDFLLKRLQERKQIEHIVIDDPIPLQLDKEMARLDTFVEECRLSDVNKERLKKELELQLRAFAQLPSYKLGRYINSSDTFDVGSATPLLLFPGLNLVVLIVLAVVVLASIFNALCALCRPTQEKKEEQVLQGEEFEQKALAPLTMKEELALIKLGYDKEGLQAIKRAHRGVCLHYKAKLSKDGEYTLYVLKQIKLGNPPCHVEEAYQIKKGGDCMRREAQNMDDEQLKKKYEEYHAEETSIGFKLT